MPGVFQNIDPPPPPSGHCVPPLVRVEDTFAEWREGWGVNILEDARHSSVLHICKYFVVLVKIRRMLRKRNFRATHVYARLLNVRIVGGHQHNMTSSGSRRPPINRCYHEKKVMGGMAGCLSKDDNKLYGL
jgi:hypothetical protein